MKNIKTLFCVSIALLIAACGGSSGGNTSPDRPALSPPTPALDTGSISPFFESAQLEFYSTLPNSLNSDSGAAVGFSVLAKTGFNIASVNWTQVSGPSLTILAPNSQSIGFDIPEAGSYSIQADVSFDGQRAETHVIEFSSAASSTSTASIRLDHTVTERGKVSLHLGVPNNKTVSSVEWTQTAGPSAQNIETDETFLFFDAPAVSQDSIIVYRANVSYTDGSSDEDEVIVTVKQVNFNLDGLFYGSNTIVSEDMYAYNPASPYKDALEKCIYGNKVPNPPNCKFSELPLIGSQTTSPSVQDILDRTLISHPWMGERFKEYLENSVAGPDMVALLRGVTAVVISYDVRPSFYWAATGAIYLDANNFWQTPFERDTLNDQADYRSDFGSDLQFSFFWRYTKDNDYYPVGRYPKQARGERSFTDLEASISWLMYHELAHANDFFPPSSWANINQSTTPLTYFNNNGTNSDVLDETYPLRSDEMHALAEVRFRNVTPTQTQRNYRGTDIEGFFVPDISASFYSYLTTREDYATLFERFMMLYRLDAEADLAIIDGQTDTDYVVVWGQRNRIAQDSLAARTGFTVMRVYPELGDAATLINQLPEPVLMHPANGWFGNLNLSEEESRGDKIASPERKMSLQERKQRALEDARPPHEHEVGMHSTP